MAWTVTGLGSMFEHDTVACTFNALLPLPGSTTHFLIVYQTSNADLFAQVLTTDGAGNLSEVGTGVIIDLTGATSGGCFIDSTHFLVVYDGVGADGFARVITIDGSYNLTLEGTLPFEFDIANGLYPQAALVDSTHALVVWSGVSADGFTIVLTWDGSYNISQASAAPLEFDLLNFSTPSRVFRLNNDPTRYIVFYTGDGSDGFAQVLTVNTSTWAVTATSFLEFDTGQATNVSAAQLDATTFAVHWASGASGRIQAISVNPSTWAVTALSSPVPTVKPLAGNIPQPTGTALLDDTGTAWIVVTVTTDITDSDIKLVVHSINKSTGVVTDLVGTPFVVASHASEVFMYPGVAKISASRAIAVWTGEAGDGFAWAFDIESDEVAAFHPSWANGSNVLLNTR